MALRSSPVSLDDRTPPALARRPSLGLLARLLALILLFAVEMLLLSVWLDNQALIDRGGILGMAGQWGAWIVRGAVGFAAIFLTFAYLKSRPALAAISAQLEQAPVSRSLLATHLAAMTTFAGLSWALYGNHLTSISPALMLALWLAAGFAGIISAALALVPLSSWLQIFRLTGLLWLFALALIVVACVAGNFTRSLWAPTTNLTFFLSKSLLTPFVSHVIADPVTKDLGTPTFLVEIAPECSGFEGIGLILAFSLCWLWLFRRECRFPQALLLIPLGVVTIFLLNAARIAALILIGNAGAPQIALGGFHSQAGWIAFNAVALGFSVVATRVSWFRNPAYQPAPAIPSTGLAQSTHNPATAYLLPFLAILAAGMLSTAASSGSGMEWLYPLRFVAAAAVLFVLRKSYTSLDWTFSVFGPAIGVLVFLLWIAFDALHPSTDAMPSALAAASAPLRIGWIVFRILAAVVTVPIAEELAFRGFLLRRLVSADFESLPLTTFTWPALVISSLAFGLLHGHFWIPGIIAGLLYSWALLRRGRIGEAIAAHATTNALLAAYVLLFHRWHLW